MLVEGRFLAILSLEREHGSWLNVKCEDDRSDFIVSTYNEDAV